MSMLAAVLSVGLLVLGASGPDDPPRTPAGKRKPEPTSKAPVVTNEDLPKSEAPTAPIVTNEDLPKGEPRDGSLSVAEPAKSDKTKKPKAKAGAEAAEPAGGAKAVDDNGHDEAYWRERMDDAERKVRQLEDDIVWAKRRITMLRMDLVVPTDAAREFNRRGEIDALLQEQAKLEADLAEARKKPDAIREEGRRAGAQPGWFR